MDTTSRPSDRTTAGRRSTLARVLFLLERDALPLVVAAAFALVVCEGVGRTLNQDGWLGLVGGREIVRNGLPSVDHLTVWGAGARWTDQQWLGQLALYGAYAAGGLRLLLLGHALVVSAVFALAVAAARRLGGSPFSTALVAVVAFVPVASTVSELRTQALASILFVAVLWLLVSDSRSPGRRVLLALPLLVLWANVHGSVVLGAGLCALAGIAAAAEQLRTPSPERRRGWQTRPLLLVAVPLACVFASPYAPSLAGYYHRTLLNHGFGRFVTEWRPTTLSAENIPVFVLAGAGLWLLGRAGSRVSLFERLAFPAITIGAFLAVRNIGWLGLTALVVLPRAFGSGPPAVRTAGRVSPVALGLVVATLGAGGTAVAAAASAPDDEVSARYPAAARRAVAAALSREPSGRVFANEEYADWLLWSVPRARGRVTFDVRFELLTEAQLRTLSRWVSRSGERWRAAGTGASVAVLPHDPSRGAALRRSGAETLYADAHVSVFALPPGFGRSPGR